MDAETAENGIVKSISDELHVFVVYHWNEEPENFENYTGARTNIEDLYEGWMIDGKCELGELSKTLKELGF